MWRWERLEIRECRKYGYVRCVAISPRAPMKAGRRERSRGAGRRSAAPAKAVTGSLPEELKKWAQMLCLYMLAIIRKIKLLNSV